MTGEDSLEPPLQQVALSVNGESRRSLVEPRTLLVHHLRDDLGLTGTHVGCDTSQCGACTVLLDGEPVKSCTIFAVQAAGHRVTTVEGLSGPEGGLHPVQRAFSEQHGLQCGYCTPGFVMSVVGLLERSPDPDEEEIADAVEGNLCRCTGYVNIERAIRAAASGGVDGCGVDGAGAAGVNEAGVNEAGAGAAASGSAS